MTQVGQAIVYLEAMDGPEQAALVTQVHSPSCVNLVAWSRREAAWVEHLSVLHAAIQRDPQGGRWVQLRAGERPA